MHQRGNLSEGYSWSSQHGSLHPGISGRVSQAGRLAHEYSSVHAVDGKMVLGRGSRKDLPCVADIIGILQAASEELTFGICSNHLG